MSTEEECLKIARWNLKKLAELKGYSFLCFQEPRGIVQHAGTDRAVVLLTDPRSKQVFVLVNKQWVTAGIIIYQSPISGDYSPQTLQSLGIPSVLDPQNIGIPYG